jgi:hypothetical protein
MLDGNDGNPIHIDGLWVLVFCNDASAGARDDAPLQRGY